ncbi:hypothetical protein C8R46DRAFT_309840 [Mycena filopes]|nr:hypothetical protein C8R46DRAFT_309840 [Mycena filopes]
MARALFWIRRSAVLIPEHRGGESCRRTVEMLSVFPPERSHAIACFANAVCAESLDSADAFYRFIINATNYASSQSAVYPYYVRKHHPLVIFDAIAQDANRGKRIRTFNNFSSDVVNGPFPQCCVLSSVVIYLDSNASTRVFVTPNMVNDAHDTTIDFA